jgi:Fe2+ or Zn2+ uptake regulation protein
MKKIDLQVFHELLCNVIYIKYGDSYIDHCTGFIKLYEYKTELLKIRQNMISNTRVSFRSPVLSSTEEVLQYQDVCDNLNKISKSIDDIVKSIYRNLEFITEIKLYTYKNSIKHESLYKLEKGYVHSVDGPAFFLNDMYTQYFIHGEILNSEEWNKHPLVRKRKIEKIKNEQRNIKTLH